MARIPFLPTAALVLAVALHGTIHAAPPEQALPSRIEAVTVYRSGAQVTRIGRTELSKGAQRIVFKDLSAEADPATLQVTAPEGVRILSVKHRLDHGRDPESDPEVKRLEERIRTIERAIQDHQVRIGILQQEEARLLKNEVVHAGERGTLPELLRAMNDYHRDRITAIRTGVVDRERNIGTLRDEAQQAHLTLGQLRSRKPRASSEVIVELEAAKAMTALLSLRYVVRSAGWSPQYDIRVDRLSEPLTLAYKANVYQSTGEDWKDVALELSSGDPQQNAVMPQLVVWRLDAGNRVVTVRRDVRPHDASVREVRGIIRDAYTGEPLPFVNVAVVSSSGETLNGAASNFDGFYAVAIPPGGRSLKYSYIAYQSHQQDIHGHTMNVELRPSTVELSALEVVQYRAPLIDRDGGATTIHREDLLSMPGRQVESRATVMMGVQHVHGARVKSGGIPANFADADSDDSGPDVTIRRRSTHFALRIAQPYSIPTDGQGHLVAVQEHVLACTYRHYAVPKLEPSAFLFAKTTGWDTLDLLPGPAMLHFEGSFIGESFLDSEQVGDTLDISLGKDRGVVVQRTRQRELSRRNFTGSRRTETIGWELEVRNTKADPIELMITDQVPVPVRSDIEMNLLRHDATNVDAERGFLHWRLDIPPRSAAKRAFGYAVKAPRNMVLVLE